jgi:hypothetical protein
MKRLACFTLCLALAAGLFVGLSPAAKETRWAFVENQTNDTLTLAYEETINGQKAKSQVPLYSGQVRRLDTTSVKGEVCVWRADEYKPAEKLGCKTLSPGDHWVIH